MGLENLQELRRAWMEALSWLGGGILDGGSCSITMRSRRRFRFSEESMFQHPRYFGSGGRSNIFEDRLI